MPTPCLKLVVQHLARREAIASNGTGNACICGKKPVGKQPISNPWKRKGRRMKKNGFTLVEIVVVVAIVGFLASMAVLAISKGVDNARTKQAETEIEMISAAVLQLAWDTGKWPNGQHRINGGSMEMWDISLPSCGLMDTDGNFNEWKGPYYDGSIEDPWGNPYFFDPDYRVNDGTMHVVVGSFGSNGKGRNLYDSDDIYVLLDD